MISGGSGGAKLVRVIIESKLLTIIGCNLAGNEGNVANNGRVNSVISVSASYGRSVAATECAMAVMEQTMEERSHTTTYGRSMVVTDSTMVAMEERPQPLRIVAASHGLINGGNGGGNGGAKLVGAIIQRKLLPISGGN